MYRHEVFRCANLESSRAYLRAAISDHDLRCGAGDVDTALHTADTGRLKLMVLRYGPEVEVRPRPFEGFSLVQIPLRGRTEIESDGHRMEVVPGQSALISPRSQVRLLWSRDCEQLIIRVPHGLIHAAAQARESWRRALTDGPQLLAPVTMINGAPGRRWNALVQSLIGLAADDAAGACHPAWVEHNELGVGVFLLAMKHGLTEPACAAGRGAEAECDRGRAPGRRDPLVPAERYVRSRLCAPIALEDLARAAGVSARTLHVYCKRLHGVGPMEWLRNVRLDVAREKLRQSRGARVTDVAMSCGFGHLGRFAAYYRERFGELPRDTAVTC